MSNERNNDYGTLMTYSAANNLYKAASAVLRSIETGLAEAPDAEVKALKSAVEGCREAIDERETFAAEIEAAREEYTQDTSCSVEIDDDPVLSVADDGVWVSAWVWVQRTDCGQDEEDDAA
jgi:hypothetical protein